MRHVFFILLAITLLTNPLGAHAQGDSLDAFAQTDPLSDATNGLVVEDEFLPVEEAYRLNAEFGENQQLRLNWQIADKYYLYKHSLNVELKDDEKVIATQTFIPDGLKKNDDYFGMVEVYYHNLDITVSPIPDSSNLSLSVTSQGCADAGLCYPPRTQHFQVDGAQLTLSETNNPTTDTRGASTAKSTDLGSLPYMLLLALFGGAILNLMPCVFPVLSLKVLAFANDKTHSQVVHGLVYTSGVVVSFIAVAAVLVSLQAAGEAIGWGFHLQSPWFVASLCYLFFVMGLSLSGFVEFGGSLMNTGGKLAEKSGYTGSFFTGILATVVASPCTAPFMGTALGFAVTQPVVIALLVFATLGFGMALPVLLLSCSPKLLKKIPKPGPWMDQLKQFLAFPLYATAVWLCWVAGNQTGVNGMAALLLGCVLITLALWLWQGKIIKRTLAAGCVAMAAALIASPLLTPTATGTNTNQSWQSYSPQKLTQLRQQGKPVFINITADWCITCLANEKVTLSTDTVKQAMNDSGITYLKADWTNRDPKITELLEQYGRTGIPLYIVYPNGNSLEGTVLPQILTINTVVDAINTATNTQQLTKH